MSNLDIGLCSSKLIVDFTLPDVKKITSVNPVQSREDLSVPYSLITGNENGSVHYWALHCLLRSTSSNDDPTAEKHQDQDKQGESIKEEEWKWVEMGSHEAHESKLIYVASGNITRIATAAIVHTEEKRSELHSQRSRVLSEQKQFNSPSLSSPTSMSRVEIKIWEAQLSAPYFKLEASATFNNTSCQAGDVQPLLSWKLLCDTTLLLAVAVGTVLRIYLQSSGREYLTLLMFTHIYIPSSL